MNTFSIVALVAMLALASASPFRGKSRAINDKECGTSQVVNRIVGGSTAQKGQYPWIASLRFLRLGKDYHTCGCSIIDDQWILVAAHCFINSKNPANYMVRVGTFDQTAGDSETEAKEYEVEKIIQHKDFSMLIKIQNDIALLKLKQKIDFSSDYVNRVCLPEQANYPTDGEILTVAGWGDEVDGQGQHIPSLLKNTDLVAKKDADCKSAWGSFMWGGEQMLCAEADNTSPCVGDSGGPLMMMDDATGKRVQVGVVSFGESSCAGPRPPVFTRVSYYLDWINDNIKANM